MKTLLFTSVMLLCLYFTSARAQHSRDEPSRIHRVRVTDRKLPISEDSGTPRSYDKSEGHSPEFSDASEKANQWLDSYKGLLNQWTEPQRTARKDVPNLEEDIIPRSPALFQDFVSKRVSAPWSSTTNAIAMTTIKSTPETTESLSSMMSNHRKDSNVHESMSENSEPMAPSKRQIPPMENLNHPVFEPAISHSGGSEAKSLSGSGKSSSFFSSFIGSFFPDFNIPKSETKSSVNIGSTHSTKPYATVSRNTDIGASTIVPTNLSNGQEVKNMDFFRERSESFSPFPSHKGNDDAPSVFFGAKTPSFSSLAVSSGYAQVIKQNDQMNMEKKNLNKRQPEIVAESKAEPLARPPLLALASRPIMDMHNDFKMEQDDKTFLSFQGEAASHQHEPSYDIRKRIGSAFIGGSSSMDMTSFDSQDNEGSTTTRAETIAPTPDLESFCQDAAETTLELHDRSEGKSQLYEKLWDLVRSYNIPVSRRDDPDQSNKQMIILLEALCGEMDEQNFSGEASSFELQSANLQAFTDPFKREINSTPRTTSVTQKRQYASSPLPTASPLTQGHTLEDELRHFTQSVPILNQRVVQELDGRKNDEFPFGIKPNTVSQMAAAKTAPSFLHSQFGSNEKERDFVVSGGFSFGPENPKLEVNLGGNLKPGKVEDVPVDRRRGPNGFRRNFRRNRPPFPGRERPHRRQPPKKRPFPRRNKPVPGDRRSSTAPSTFPFPSADEPPKDFFPGQFNERPPFPRVNGPYPSLGPRKDGPGLFPGKLQHPSPPFTPRPGVNPNPKPLLEVRREYWPPRPNIPREQNIPFKNARSPYKNRVRTNNLPRPRPTSLQQLAAQGQEYLSSPRPLDQILTTSPPKREYTLFSQNDAFASTETNFDSDLAEPSQVPPQRVPFVNSQQHASSKLSNLVDVDDQDNGQAWGSQAIPNGNENDLATEINGDEIDNGNSTVDDVHYVYNVTFFTPTIPDETNQINNQTTQTGDDISPTVEYTTENSVVEQVEYTYKGREGENDEAYYYYEDEDHEANDMVSQSPSISSKTPRRDTEWQRAAISTPNPGFAYPGFDLHAPRTHMISTSTFAPLPQTTTESYFPIADQKSNFDVNEDSNQPTVPKRAKPLISMTFGTHTPILQGHLEESKANSHYPQRLEVEVKQTPNRHQTQQLEIEEVFSHNQDEDSTEFGLTTTKTIFLDEVEVDRSKLKGGNLPSLTKDKKQTNHIAESQDPSAFESKFNSGAVYDPFVPANKRRSTLPPATFAPPSELPIISSSSTTTISTTTTTTATTTTETAPSISSPVEEGKIESNELYEYDYVYEDTEESLSSPTVPQDIEERPLEDDPLSLAEVRPEETIVPSMEEELPSEEISPIILSQSDTSPNNGSDNNQSMVEDEAISPGFPPNENDENTSTSIETTESNSRHKDGSSSSLEHPANNDQSELNDDTKSFPSTLQSDHEESNPISQEYQYYYEDVNNLSEEQKAKFDVILPPKENPPTLLGLNIPQAALDNVGESKEDYDSLYNDVETLLPDSASSRSNGFHTTTSSLTRNDRFAKNGLPSENDLESAPFAILRKSQEEEAENAMNPEKLAYILIGVCCGLSILCLIVVAISIGYKSETHYRLDDGRRKRHIKLLRASPGNDEGESVTSSGHNNYADSVDEATTSSEDLSGMKLGPWFNGKHHIQTLDRKSNMVFPTSVYLENLESGTEGGEGDEKRERDGGEANPTTKNALSVKTVKDLEANLEPETHSPANETSSLSSFDTLRTDPNLLRDPEPGFPRPHAMHSSRNNLSASSSVRANFKKHSSYAIGSNRFTQGTFNLNKAGRRMGSITKTKGSSVSDADNALTTSTGSFRFLVEDDSVSENSSQVGGPINRADKSGSYSGGGVEGDTNREFGEIHWSSNVDRLI